MTNYKLSVVVLVYNTEEYIRECLDSLVNQTLDGIEIIMVNDESPDDSLSIIEEYQKQYSNIKVINQKNSGGAVAGNNGMKIATGEYITLMDSDDVVPLDAYEKLYNKAKETGSDIVIGKPKILLNGEKKDVLYKKEQLVWEKERTITNIEEFPDIFYDGFYWNKIYRREFLFKHEAFMPPGMLYADRPMVHKAFLYANQIHIIPDVVYYWRKRAEDAAAKSITQLKGDIKNFLDRMESLYYQLKYFNDFGNPSLTDQFMRRNLDRLLFPIKGILEDREFRNVYVAEVKKALELIENVYDNDLGIIKNLYFYMILNNLREELMYYLAIDPKGEVIEEEGKYYWSLPFFRNPSVGIPDDLFEIKTLTANIIKIDTIKVVNSTLSIQGVKVPDTFNVNQIKLECKSQIHNTPSYIIDFTKLYNGYSLEFDLQNLNSNEHIFDLYELSLIVEYSDYTDKIRMTKSMLASKTSLTSERENDYYVHFTKKNNLSLRVKGFQSKLIVSLNHTGIKVNSDSQDEFILYVKDRASKEEIQFKKEANGEHHLKWSHFLDPNSYYNLYLRVSNNNYRLSSHAIKGFSTQSLKAQGIAIEMFETTKGNVSLRSISTLSKFVGTLRKII
ncbi:glycosyltransferase family 2 protein [Bacillus suaedaesalsae]|uniref:Glycosyltransferase family 2 protein n=1 Tax=Bacillus suaedaesalsae TaxID=2810349 RepID=A0ABS2DL21_9BACI|nr:glycosyltransferase family 2 protein [Bacillus suaedaesalsae]MBM6619092.1 glycosyltransferase family 2 protein [Bacillus suaedaesalsae]